MRRHVHRLATSLAAIADRLDARRPQLERRMSRHPAQAQRLVQLQRW